MQLSAGLAPLLASADDAAPTAGDAVRRMLHEVVAEDVKYTRIPCVFAPKRVFMSKICVVWVLLETPCIIEEPSPVSEP